MIQRGGEILGRFYGGLVGASLGVHFLCAIEKTSALENGGHSRAEHRVGLRLWPHRLFVERLLLWTRLFAALGNPISGG